MKYGRMVCVKLEVSWRLNNKVNFIIKMKSSSSGFICYLFLSLSFFSLSVFSQNPEVVFYDFEYNKISQDSAYYYRKAVFNENGTPNGDVTDFYMFGKVYMKGKYTNGKRNGNFTWWHENGEMKEMGSYNKNEYTIDNTWDESGNIIIVGGSGQYIEKYENKKIKSDGNYSRGKKTGIWLLWYPDGKKKEKWNYTNGDGKMISAWKMNGEIMVENGTGDYVEEFKNGKVKSSGFYKDGKREGLWNWNYSNSAIRSEISYISGKRQGKATFYFQSGETQSTENYLDDLRNGECIYYNSSGKKNEVTKYRNDTLLFSQLKFTPGEELYAKIDSMPFCKSDLNKFFNENLNFPSSEAATGWTGVVHVGFTVNEQGAIEDVKLVKEATQAFNDESLRVIRLMPEWQPGIYQGKPVKVRIVFPLKYGLYTAR
jgi:TonB family protein